jgi:type II secretory pathway pseudopilin PulG
MTQVSFGGERAQSGFTYIGLLILIAILSVAATATIQLGAVVQRRDAEQQLLYLGEQFRLALRSYRDSSPTGTPPFPKELTQLLKDPRFPGIRRHLRSIPVDPLTGNANWGLVRSPEGWIIGVHSLSEARPIKVDNFEPEYASFANKEKISEWVFSGLPVLLQRPGDATKMLQPQPPQQQPLKPQPEQKPSG